MNNLPAIRVVVTGATGFIGSAVCAALQNTGASICGVLRPGARCAVRTDETMTVDDLSVVGDWRDRLAGVDAVIHLAARAHILQETAADPLHEFRKTNVLATERLARGAADAGVKRFVFLSSIGVNGTTTTCAPFSETDAPQPTTPYAISKWEAEQVLREISSATGLSTVILRPPLVYGPWVKGNFLRLLQWSGKGYPLPFGRVENRRSFIYLENLVDALLACLIHPKAVGKVFLVNDDEDISTAGLIRFLSEAMNTPPRLLHVPVALLTLAGRVLGKSTELDRLLGSLEIDGRRIRSELGWTPPHTLAFGLARTAEWYCLHRGKRREAGTA